MIQLLQPQPRRTEDGKEKRLKKGKDEVEVEDSADRGKCVTGWSNETIWSLPVKLGSPETKIDFESFKVAKFVPHLFLNNLYQTRGCGASTLSLLTGTNPFNIPHRKDWTKKFMVEFLRKRGFRVAELTLLGTTTGESATYPITTSHVVMASVMMRKNEASWIVINNNIMYHNYETLTFNAYELVNHPVVSSFLVYSKLWRGGKILPERRRRRRK